MLPRTYFERVFALQRELFPEEWFESHRVRNCLQTNLYVVRDEHLDVFEEHGVELGVSVDFAQGVRLTAGGRPTEAVVRATIRIAAHLENRGFFDDEFGSAAHEVTAAYLADAFGATISY